LGRGKPFLAGIGSLTGKQVGLNQTLIGSDNEINQIYGDAAGYITDNARGGDDILVGGNLTDQGFGINILAGDAGLLCQEKLKGATIP
jgi:hypothetical protein